MQRLNLKKHRVFLCVSLTLIATAGLRQIGFYVNEQFDLLFIILRASIYLILFAAWGVSTRNRIIQPQVRRYLTGVSALMIFWITVRTIRYSLDDAPWVMRHLWYLYYLPMLFIPLLALFVALSLGQPGNFRLPKWTTLLYIPTAALLLLVLTNDLHQLVFVFPADAVVWMDDYHYAIGYFLAVGWIILCTLTALVTMLIKCRVPHSRKVLVMPFVPVAAALLYGALYILRVLGVFRLTWLRVIAGDMTVVFCLLITAVLESCIQCDLIQSNTHYNDLLQCCTLRVQLTDPNYQVLLASRSAEPIPLGTMQQTEAGPVRLDGGLRLSGAAVRGGHVLWTEDVSELLEVLEALQDVQDSLEDSNALLRAEYTLKAREAHIAEQDRLYNIIQQETAPRITLLAALTDAFEAAESETERKKLLGKMAVIGAYLKRRSNLIFLADKTPVLQEKELSLTFGESMDNLELCGVTCGLLSELNGPVKAGQLMSMYDFFEELVEHSLDSMTTVTVWIRQAGNSLRITTNTDSTVDLSPLASDSVSVLRDEDGEWQLSMVLDAGGEPQ
ncbi:MAG: histidine kinase N-terminal 7TM domain-containing protein [Candidatus Avoscillospira sp.]